MAITYPSIGGVTVLRMDGRVTPLAKTLEKFRRPGINGVGLFDLGTDAPSVVVMTVADVASAATHVASCKALAGTLVTVVHPDGESITNVAVMAPPEYVSSKKVGTPVGGTSAGAYLVTMRWLLQATA